MLWRRRGESVMKVRITGFMLKEFAIIFHPSVENIISIPLPLTI
jgi:hypothetical protein